MKYLLSVLFVFTAAQVHAQEAVNTTTGTVQATPEAPAPSIVHITPSISYTTVTLRGDNSIPWTTDSGLSLGAFAEFGTGLTTFQTGLFYNDYNSTAGNADIAATAKLSYISVPLLEKLNFLRNDKRTVYFKAGIAPEVLVARNVSAFGPKISGPEAIQFEKYDVPVVAGLGFTWNVSKEKAFTGEVSYMRGLTNVNKSPTDGANIHNEGAMITAGMTVAL